jgi:hypothetical protein
VRCPQRHKSRWRLHYWTGGAECRWGPHSPILWGAGFELSPRPRLAFCYSASHQTTKFPPTPSIRSTSASHVRMITLRYYIFTVITIPTTIPCDPLPPYILAFLPLTIHHPLPTLFLCERTATPATPFRSCAYFTVLWIPRGGGSGTGFSLCSFIASAKIHPRLRPARSVRHPSPPTRHCPSISFRHDP